MANLTDSGAAFCHRMTELEFDNSQQKGLLDQGLNSFAKLAFAASNQPGQIDETKFGKLVTTCFAADSVTLGLESQMRRLIFEAITHTVQSIADRTRDPIAGEDMKMPPQERDRRLADQRLRLSGLLIRHATEPAHGLVDKFVKMVHDSCLKYIPLPGCVSREDELCNERTSKKLLHLEHNQLVVKSKDSSMRLDLNCPLRLQQALTRRALAADQAGVVSFAALDMVTHGFLAHLNRPVPPGFDGPSVSSVIRADQELWKLVADAAGSKIQADATGTKPLDALFQKMSSEATVVFHLLPTPKGAGGDKPYKKTKKRPVSSGSEDSEPKRRKPDKPDKSKRAAVPKALKGLSARNKKGVPYCFNFNLAHGCTGKASGTPLRCSRGLHACMKCGREHGQHECRD